jgi:CBS domain containing-hemolysin-like protein
MSLDDFRREYPALPDLPGVVTLGGALVHLLEVVPQPGQSATLSHLRLTAETVDERRVLQLTAEVVKR